MKQSTQYLMSLESEDPENKLQKPLCNYLNQQELNKAKYNKQLCSTKIAINKQIWNNAQNNLQDLLLQYPFSEEIGFTARDLLNQKNVKLIRSEHRIYFGEISKTKKQGKGISLYADGKLYEGYHLNNQKNGLGSQLYNNGNLYIGNFDRNKKHGKGTFYWLNLEENGVIQYYIGQWWDGLPSGNGKHQRCNGDLYQGEFRNGLKHGQGMEYFSNGDRYQGQYVNGLPQGYGQYTWSNNSNYKGQFKQGLRYGFGCWKKDQTQNCQSYRGHYMMDLKSGHGIYTWSDGKFYKGQFANDKKHGFGQLYQNQTLKYRGIWQDGRPSQNSSRIGQNTLNRIRSNSNSIQSFHKPNTFKGHNQSHQSSTRTHKILSFKNKIESRQPIFFRNQSAKPTNKIKLKRPSTGALDMNNLRKNSAYRIKGGSKELDSQSQRQSKHFLKTGHQNCIPIYPWQQKSVMKN